MEKNNQGPSSAADYSGRAVRVKRGVGGWWGSGVDSSRASSRTGVVLGETCRGQRRCGRITWSVVADTDESKRCNATVLHLGKAAGQKAGLILSKVAILL
jgi:hypothetical protein